MSEKNIQEENVPNETINETAKESKDNNVEYAADINPEYYGMKPITAADGKNKSISISQTDGSASNIYDWVRCFLFALIIVIFCLTFLFRLVDVKGTSMVSTLQNKDMVIVTNFAYTPNNNDIVVISHGAEYDEPLIKRVIATEGQSLQLDFENDRIIVDGIVLDEPYIEDSTFSGGVSNYEIPTVIPEGKIFVMGDNRGVSMDSRSSKIGLIDVENVIGKAQVVVFPFSDFTYLY